MNLFMVLQRATELPIENVRRAFEASRIIIPILFMIGAYLLIKYRILKMAVLKEKHNKGK